MVGAFFYLKKGFEPVVHLASVRFGGDARDIKCDGSRSERTRAEHESIWAGQKKRLVSTSRFFSYIRLWRVILLCSDIRLKPSDIALRAVKWANIISLKP